VTEELQAKDCLQAEQDRMTELRTTLLEQEAANEEQVVALARANASLLALEAEVENGLQRRVMQTTRQH